VITRKTISGVAVAAGLLSFSVGAAAQDVLLKVSTTVGAGEPRAAEHKVTAGSEVAIYSDSLYRVLVKPTVVSDAGVQLSLRVLDATSGELVGAPSMLAAVGQKATYSQGSQPTDPKNLRIDLTPSL
jgi:hypothetical protein